MPMHGVVGGAYQQDSVFQGYIILVIIWAQVPHSRYWNSSDIMPSREELAICSEYSRMMEEYSCQV